MKNNFKKWIPFIIFLFLCMLIYSKHGMIEVKAFNVSEYDKNNSKIELTFNNSYNDVISSDLNNPLKFSGSISNKLMNFYISVKLSEPTPTINSNAYMTFHFKYYYDITDTDNFHFKDDIAGYDSDKFGSSYGNIYEEKLYTSIDNEGFYSYDYFVTFHFLPTNMCSITVYPYCQDGTNYFTVSSYTRDPNTSIVPNSKTSFEMVQFLLTDEGTLPLSIDDYISSQDIVYSNPQDQPYQEEVDNSILGYIKRIWNKIVAIGAGILSFPERIVNFIRDLFSGGLTGFDIDLTSFILDPLEYLFIPEEGYFKLKIEGIYDLLEEQFGFLFTPFELLFEVLNKFQNLSNDSSGIIHIPNIYDPFYNQLIIQEQNFNLKSIFQTGSLNTYYNLYLDLVDVSLIVLLVNMFLRKFNSIFSGDGEHE